METKLINKDIQVIYFGGKSYLVKGPIWQGFSEFIKTRQL